MHATIPKGIVGGFEFSVFQRNLKELAGKAMGMSLRVLKESNKSRFDSYSRQEQSIDHIPCYLSGLSRAHFFSTTFLEIAVYNRVQAIETIPWRKASFNSDEMWDDPDDRGDHNRLDRTEVYTWSGLSTGFQVMTQIVSIVSIVPSV